MTNSLPSQLSEALDRLVEKTDQLHQSMSRDAELEARFVAGFERLIEVVAHLERQQKVESWLAKKLEETVPRLNKALKKQDRASSGVKGELGENIERIARIVKVVGQVAEILAGSMQVISKAYRENKTDTPGTGNVDAKNDAVDLTGILTKLNDLVKSGVGARGFSDGDKAVSPDLSYKPDAETAGGNEEKANEQIFSGISCQIKP